MSDRIACDLKLPGYPPLIHAVQGDQYSRRLIINLYDGGVAWPVPGGVYVAMRYSKPDGTHGYYDTLPDGTQAWSAEGNTVSIYVAPQMLTVPGPVQGQLEIIQNQSILASFPIRLKVAANLAAPLQTSENYTNWLEWMEDQLTQRWEDAIASGELTGPQGPPPTKLGDVTDYQSSPSGDTIPTGEWTETIPAVPQGQYLWTRVTTSWDSGSPVVSYTSARQGVDGASVTRLSSVTDYQVGESGERVPTGEWSEAIPAVPQGKFLWTRRTQTYSSGPPTVDYSVVRQPVDGTGSVSSVFGISPGPDGNVPTTGALEALGGLALSGGTMTGAIDMDGHTISGLNPPTEDTQAVNKGYLDGSVRKAAPRNLLDNSDFRNLVNQSGIGGSHGSIAYAADRWILDSGTVSYKAGVGLTLNGTIRQKLESPPTGETSAFVGIASGDASISCADGEVTIISSGGVLKWAALYEGEYTAETLPEYQPKGYGAELVECMRYYQRVRGYYFSGINTSVILSPPMRINPTIDGYSQRYDSGVGWTTVDPSEANISVTSKNVIRLYASNAGSVTYNAYFAAIADL